MKTFFRFDFLGIPQIPIPALDEDHPGTWVKVDEDQNETAAVAYQVIPGTINPNGSGLDGDSEHANWYTITTTIMVIFIIPLTRA